LSPDPARPLRIAHIAPVAAPVRPGEGGSIEQLVSLLSEELVRRGHDVTLYATSDSHTSARLRAAHPHGYDTDDELWDWQFHEAINAARAFEHAGEHDVIHAHDYHAVPFSRLVSTPLIVTPHVAVAPESVRAYADRPDVEVVAISDFQSGLLAGAPSLTVIRHGIDVAAFPFEGRVGSHLLFLGRMLADKGAADAIRIAHAAGMELVLAGGAEEGYDVAAELGIDGERVRYVGRVGAAERNRLLASAAALLFPAVYPEPFGLVMLEAMACGTPVLASRLGAVPEIVEDGVTGFTAPTWEGLADLVAAARALDRATVRAAAEARWDFRRMVDEHEALYRRVAGR